VTARPATRTRHCCCAAAARRPSSRAAAVPRCQGLETATALPRLAREAERRGTATAAHPHACAAAVTAAAQRGACRTRQACGGCASHRGTASCDHRAAPPPPPPPPSSATPQTRMIAHQDRQRLQQPRGTAFAGPATSTATAAATRRQPLLHAPPSSAPNTHATYTSCNAVGRACSDLRVRTTQRARQLRGPGHGACRDSTKAARTAAPTRQ
jgi:hypothetical protein